jgi:uncharacterized protein YkwD
MIRGMKVNSKTTFVLFTCLLAFSLLGMDASPYCIKANKTTNSKGGSAYDVIASVNQIRAVNGLSPYQIDGSLMASAQAHSDYQASIGSITHTGSGGSDVKSRAIAAGYGSGAAVSVIENIYGGTNATPQQAVSNWQGDSLHLNTLLSSKAVDVGAGVATDGSLVYYTLDVGYVVGNEGSGSSSSSGSSTTTSSSAAPATAIAFYPVQVSTPRPDGSIIHIVQAGQTLWSIAATYKISLPDLLNLNGFTNSTFIYPGQKITIKSSGTLMSETPAQAGSPEAVTATQEPTDTALPMQASEEAMVGTNEVKRLTEVERFSTTPVLGSSSTPLPGTDLILWVIAIFVLSGTVLMVIGSVLQRRK